MHVSDEGVTQVKFQRESVRRRVAMLNYEEPRRVAQRKLQSIASEAKYLNDLPQSQVLYLIQMGQVKKFGPEEMLLSQGSKIEEVYLVLHGTVSVGVYTDSNPAMWLYISGPGTVVDMCALLDPAESPVSIRALSEVEVLAIPRDRFVEVIEEYPDVGYTIMRNLCVRMSVINQVTLMEFAQEHPGPSHN